MAGLNKQTVTIPLGASQDQSVDPKMLPAGTLAGARNVRYNKHGLISKAPGWAESAYTLPRVGTALKPPATLTQHRGRLLASGHVQDASFHTYDAEGFKLCEHIDATDEMIPAGDWPPIGQRSTRVTYGETFVDPDVCYLGGYVWAAWADGDNVYMTVQVELTGAVVLQPTVIAAMANTCSSVQCVALDSVVHVYFVQDAGGTATIHQVIVEVADPTNPALSAGSIACKTGTACHCCRLDSVALGTLAGVGYIEPGGTLWVKTFLEDGTASAQVGASPGTPVGGVMGMCQVYDNDGTVNLCGVFWPEGGNLKYSFHSIAAGMAQTATGNAAAYTGTVNAVTAAQEDSFYWEFGSPYSIAHIYFEEEITGTYSTYRKVRHVRYGFAGGGLLPEGIPWMYHGLLTKAFPYYSRSHVWLWHDSTLNPHATLVCSGRRLEAPGLEPVLVPEAIYQIGRSNHRDNCSRPGVSLIGSSFVWAADSTEYGSERSASIVWLNYLERNLKPASFDDDLVLPGGLLRCYDGSTIADHCIPHPPEIPDSAEAHGAAAGGYLWEDESYYYVACYEWVDASGLLHISEPSAIEQVDVGIDRYLNGQTLTIDATNDALDILDTGTAITYAVFVPHGTYASFDELAQAITDAMVAAGCGQTWCLYSTPVTWNYAPTDGPLDPFKMEFAANYALGPGGPFTFLFATGVNAATSICTAIGFTAVDQSTAYAAGRTPLWSLIGAYECEAEPARQQGKVTLKVRPLSGGDYDRDYDHTRIGIYRTPKGGGEYHLVDYLDNDPTVEVQTYVDTMADEDLDVKPLLYSSGEPGSVVPNGPIASHRICVHQGRMWAIDDEDPSRLAFTKKRSPGVAAEFSPSLYVVLSEDAEAIGSIGGALIVFSESKIWAITGEGPDDTGVGEFYPARLVSSVVGCDIQASVCQTSTGLVFAGTDGRIYQLDMSLSVRRIDEPVEDELDGRVVTQIVLDRENQLVRVMLAKTATTHGTQLVYDYGHDRWSPWDGFAGIRNCLPTEAGVYHLAEYSTVAGKLLVETPAAWKRNAVAYPLDISTAWIRLQALMGFQRVWWEYVLGTWKSAHSLVMEIYLDYSDTPSETVSIDLSTDPGGYLIRRKLAKQKCTAIKVRLYDADQAGTCESCELTGLEMVVGAKGPQLRRSKKTG